MMTEDAGGEAGAPRQLKTLSRKDPEFFSYLDGSFSKTARALPVRSLNVGTQQERVTFDIVPRSQIRTPNLAYQLLLLSRFPSLILSLGPLVVIYCFCLARHHAFNQRVALISALGVLSFHISAHLFNDYGDHVRGRDRLRIRGGSRVIQKGWLTAKTVRRAAWGALALAAICGVPAILEPADGFSPVWIIVGFAGFAMLEFAFQRLRLSVRGWTEVLAFMLTGPLLTLGYSAAISGRLMWAEAVLGAAFGAQTLMFFHATNFENIMIDSQARVSTWATRAGFDASKRFFYFTGFLSSASLFVYASFFEHSMWFVLPVLVHVSAVLILCDRVRHLASPLSSRLLGLRRAVLVSAWITAFSLAAVFLGRAWI